MRSRILLPRVFLFIDKLNVNVVLQTAVVARTETASPLSDVNFSGLSLGLLGQLLFELSEVPRLASL